MIRISKKVDYAIILLSHLGKSSTPVSAQEMASRYHLPQPMVANILKELTSNQLIESRRGQQGGYSLSQDPIKITLAYIIKIIDGPFAFVECADDEKSPCMCKAQNCPAQGTLVALHQRLLQFMESVTLATFINQDSLNPL